MATATQAPNGVERDDDVVIERDVTLSDITLNTDIQCRAAIDMEVVKDYVEAMREGAKFPLVELFGPAVGTLWIGDGWHRILAMRDLGFRTIKARVHEAGDEGGRRAALRYALRANAHHGQRRTNADKRRAVEIAIREFWNLSNREIAGMCGVSDMLVGAVRPQVQDSCTSRPRPVERKAVDASPADPSREIPDDKRIGRDGKLYPARRARATVPESAATVGVNAAFTSAAPPSPPENGLQFARMAVMDLEQIHDDDECRVEALMSVKAWIETALVRRDPRWAASFAAEAAATNVKVLVATVESLLHALEGGSNWRRLPKRVVQAAKRARRQLAGLNSVLQAAAAPKPTITPTPATAPTFQSIFKANQPAERR